MDFVQERKPDFIGFNSFLRETPEYPLTIGEESIVKPHTIIDLIEPVSNPSGHLVWGYISNSNDLKNHCLPLEEFSKIMDGLVMGELLLSIDAVVFC